MEHNPSIEPNRLDKIRLFNAVNIEQSYKPLTIYSPREVISHATEN